MFVRSVMIPKEKCVTVQIGESLENVLQLLRREDIDALPVLDGDEYKGIVNQYLTYEAYFHSGKDKESYLAETTLNDIAIRKEITLSIDDVFEKSFVEISDFPIIAVTEGEKFLGIVTRPDIVNQVKSAFGMRRKGVRITFTSVETEGQIARLGELLHKYHETVISLITFDETDKLVRRIVLKVEQNDNLGQFMKQLEKIGFRVLHIHEED
ncbi:CBS domain-containing protein [Bhargavaea ginsengi]|uniref:CBS domain-containing protein n=1 Tax=Bhargavaea ginsengi TaxID=426757 RepID=A0A1H6SD62_9BACL|nr:CBS domain-containing protein [Bhargavaea ginsengi]MCM3088200.1 CBS domain-containing protein [Bhargavaea ginsengi]SEI65953.1 CBS domain-containing protein [Bhargavaea ginsengi]